MIYLYVVHSYIHISLTKSPFGEYFMCGRTSHYGNEYSFTLNVIRDYSYILMHILWLCSHICVPITYSAVH